MVGNSRAGTGEPEYDRNAELRAFEETKTGVKGLVDTGITNLPRMFIHPKGSIPQNYTSSDGDTVLLPKLPIIDLAGVGASSGTRRAIFEKVRDASENWGFFQVINHGIPASVLEEMIGGVRRFNEQDDEVKKQWFSRDPTKKVIYNSNAALFAASTAYWKDTMYCFMAPDVPSPEELPEVCSDILIKYSKEVMNLGRLLLELLSEGLGLHPNYLKELECAKGLKVFCHYYPECPQPELTMGTGAHWDNNFITVLLQDHIGGLQILHHDQWIDVLPTPGALLVNIGDLLQLISNDKYKSVKHRVLAKNVGPRISVASFFSTSIASTGKLYGPIKELVSEENPARYRETTVKEYVEFSRAKGIGATSSLLDFEL